jgi:hypothetical protein
MSLVLPNGTRTVPLPAPGLSPDRVRKLIKDSRQPVSRQPVTRRPQKTASRGGYR